jgi:hypothetical protein
MLAVTAAAGGIAAGGFGGQFGVLSGAAAQAQAAKRIDQFDSALDNIISTSEPIIDLATNLGGVSNLEGPLWWKEGGFLLFRGTDEFVGCRTDAPLVRPARTRTTCHRHVTGVAYFDSHDGFGHRGRFVLRHHRFPAHHQHLRCDRPLPPARLRAAAVRDASRYTCGRSAASTISSRRRCARHSSSPIPHSN